MRRLGSAVLMMVAFALGAAAQGRIDVDESDIRAELKAGVTAVSIPVRNSTLAAVTGQLRLEWLDPRDTVRATAVRPVSIARGESRADMTFPLPATQSNNQIYLRLRYTLSPTGRAAMRGTLALSSIAGHAFVLQVAGTNTAKPGTDFVFRAHAVHFETRKLVPGVRFTAALTLDKRSIPPSNARSDADGTTIFTFPIPAGTRADVDATLRVTARNGDFHQTSAPNLVITNNPSAQIETDKRLYQPGQTLHVRAIVLNAAGRAAAREPVRLQVRNSNDDVLRDTQLTTSHYGVIHDDVELPPGAPLGRYSIRVSQRDGEATIDSENVTVSKYELPSFTVTTKLDRPYYLPDQTAKVDVSAVYLFGKPVPKAKVRIARAGASSMDQITSGEADSTGHFRALITLRWLLEEAEKYGKQRFADVSFDAFCTDPESGRTEQIRFDVRITREPIHVYVSAGQGRGGPLPVPVFVSTWYADGTPVEATVQVQLGKQSVSAKTNRLGIGKVLLEPADGDLSAEAVDAAGLRGKWKGPIYIQDANTLRVTPNKSILGPGEPVVLTIEAPDDGLDVAVNAVANDLTVESRRARIEKGKARLEFPWRPEFRRLVRFTVYSGDEREGHAAVVFPDAASLQVTATPERKEYRPGEDAAVSFAVKGQSPQGILGVAIVNQAVAERARTDSQFGRRSYNLYRTPEMKLEEFYQLDPTQPIPNGLDLAAEAVLANEVTELDLDWIYPADLAMVFRDFAHTQFEPFDKALNEEYSQTLSYPVTRDELMEILNRRRLPIAGLRDPWGTPYTINFVAESNSHIIAFRSAGPDRKHGTADDYDAHRVGRSHFRLHYAAIERAFTTWGKCGRDLTEIRAALASYGILLDSLKDPLGNTYRVELDKPAWKGRVLTFNSPGFSETIDVPCPVPHEQQIRAVLDSATVFPATEMELRARLAGAGIDLDSLRDPWGDRYAIHFRADDRVVGTEKPVELYAGLSGKRANPLPQRWVYINLDSSKGGTVTFSGLVDPVPLGPVSGSGALCGEVRSLFDTVLPYATLRLRPKAAAAHGTYYQLTSGADGGYCFRGMPSGRYVLTATRKDYELREIDEIPIADGYTTLIKVELEQINFRSAFDSGPALRGVPGGTAGGIIGALSTPRVREYFPETLLWAPEVETDADGRATLKFRMADNITNWRLAATASTPDGRIAKTTVDIRAFQPFFADLNPPAVLTAGDRIDLPVPVRNYLDQPQLVTVEMKENAWSEWKGPARKQTEVPASGTEKLVFPLLATKVVDAGKVRATAIGATESDAIEKPVRVHPDGQETAQSISDLTSGRTILSVHVPDGAIPGAVTGELRISPSPFAALRDAIERMLARPYGCAEQTTSAGQSNLIALRYARSIGLRDAAFEKQAIRNLELTRDRLKTNRAPGGGFNFWGRGPADLAVTAYVLRFLTEASEFIPVDAALIKSTSEWLMNQRGAEGRWGANSANSWATTAVVARGLAAARHGNNALPAPPVASLFGVQDQEPYVVAQLALAAMDLGDTVTAGKAVASLKGRAQSDANGVSWHAAGYTAFGGWGRPATIETTAAAITALARWRSLHPAETALDPLIRRGIVYLLRGRDRYGVWYSTQATAAVMHAVAAASRFFETGAGSRRIAISVNGEALREITIPSGESASVDLGGKLHAGENRIELVPAAGSGAAIAAVFSTHWLPWNIAKPRTAEGMTFRVAFDRTEAAIGENIECRVEANRALGWGMLLAEIGLPPGAEVDRQSLEEVLQKIDSRLYRYEVQPDRVVLYLWPQKDGTASVRFRFQPRLAMEAKSAMSMLYDYYNPESLAEVAPVVFRVH